MKPSLFACLVTAFLATPVIATEIPNLGRLEFENSGSEAAQEPFARGVLLLHNFEYEDAREAFRHAQRIDPDFALAYWGEAMTHNHPLWRQQDRAAALEALGRYAPTAAERAVKAPTERERAWLGAVEKLYGAGDKVARDLAYEERMRALTAAYPEDMEARAFHALSILGTTQGERDFRTYMRAGAVAEEVFAVNDRHPGAAHYMIHSYDDPVHAPLGIRAARVYAAIAPAASHAQHMISHIWVALGRWNDSVASNVEAFAVSRERRERKGLSEDALNYHAMQWLQYSYLQLGRWEEGQQILDEMRAYAEQTRTSRSLWYYAAMRSMWIVETGGTDLPPRLDYGPLEVDGAVQDLYATGRAALRVDDPAGAEQAILSIRRRRAALEEELSDRAGDGSGVEGTLRDARVMEASLEALLALHTSRTDEALALLEEAVALEAGRPLEYGPPTIVEPSHELYGAVLLELDRPQEALSQFHTALERAPRRTRSLQGVAAAAHRLGLEAELRAACRELHTTWAGSEEPRIPLPDPCSG